LQEKVRHFCNPSYSGGRDQDDCGLKLAPSKQFIKTLSQKNPSQKGAGGVAQNVGPEFKPQHHKKKKRRRRKGVILLYVFLSGRRRFSGSSQQASYHVSLA
jgi:hypothetical protein